MDTNNKVKLVQEMVTQGAIPQYLYRFRPINEYLDDIISNNQLWFSKPVDFNDPFDCNITIDTNNTNLEISKYINDQVSAKEPNLDYDTIKRMREVFSDPNHRKKIMEQSRQKAVKSMGICCFTKGWNNILLWSHYTNSHKGVALKFNLNIDPHFFLVPGNVIYPSDNKYPIYNHLRDSYKDLLIKLMITKSNIWSYEEEVRVMKNTSGNHTFKKECLAEVVFGVKCSESDIDHIKKLLFDKGYVNVSFKKAVLNDNEFSLKLVPI